MRLRVGNVHLRVGHVCLCVGLVRLCVGNVRLGVGLSVGLDVGLGAGLDVGLGAGLDVGLGAGFRVAGLFDRLGNHFSISMSENRDVTVDSDVEKVGSVMTNVESCAPTSKDSALSSFINKAHKSKHKFQMHLSQIISNLKICL